MVSPKNIMSIALKCVYHKVKILTTQYNIGSVFRLHHCHEPHFATCGRNTLIQEMVSSIIRDVFPQKTVHFKCAYLSTLAYR